MGNIDYDKLAQEKLTDLAGDISALYRKAASLGLLEPSPDPQSIGAAEIWALGDTSWQRSELAPETLCDYHMVNPAQIAAFLAHFPKALPTFFLIPSKVREYFPGTEFHAEVRIDPEFYDNVSLHIDGYTQSRTSFEEFFAQEEKFQEAWWFTLDAAEKAHHRLHLSLRKHLPADDEDETNKA